METENIFTGLSEFQREIIFKFEEFVVTIIKEDADKYKINIDPGSYDLYHDYNNNDFDEYFNLESRIELNDNYKINGYWYIRIGFDIYWGDFFKNGDILNAAKINVILNNIKSSAEFIKEHNGTIKNKKEFNLMTTDEMKDMVDNKKILPSTVSRIKWEKVLEKVEYEKIESGYDLDGLDGNTCALCYKYGESCKHQFTLSKCPLNIIGENCNKGSSIWRDINWQVNKNHAELVNNIKRMITALKKAEEYEKKSLNEVYEIGKMKVTLIPQCDDKVILEIDGMKSEEDTPDGYSWNVPRCYIKSDPTEIYIRDSNEHTLAWCVPENLIRTKDEAMKIIECLKECSKKLHDMNEPKKVEETYSFGKMVLRIKELDGDVYTCSITGMKEYNNLPHDYIEGRDKVCCCIITSDNRFMMVNKYYKNFIFSQYESDYDRYYVPVDNFKVTKEEFEELKELLQMCSDNLRNINHPKVEKEKLTIKVTPTENGKVILEIDGMDNTYFNDTESFRSRHGCTENTIIITNEKMEYIIPDGCNNNCMWIKIGKNNPMTWFAAERIITYLGASAAKLHAKNHIGKSYTLVL